MQMAHLLHDHRFMPQIVSSAIWNCPPPATLVKLLERTNRSCKVTHKSQEKMVRIFEVPTCLTPAPLQISLLRWMCIISWAANAVHVGTVSGMAEHWRDELIVLLCP